MQRRRLFALAACLGAACGGETTRATGWSDPVALDDGAASDGAAALGGDAARNAVATWTRRDVHGVAAARFDGATRAWTQPLPLAAGAVDDADQIDLDVQVGGEAVVVWRQLSAGLQSIWSSWLDPKTGAWHDAVPAERDETGDAAEPCVATLSTGGAVAVWHQWDGLRESLWANRLGGAPLTWTGRALLETTDSADAIEPDVATDQQGNAVAVWTQSDGAAVTIWASRRSATGDPWSAPTMLSGTGVYEARATPSPRVALDASGDGIAIWSLATENTSALWASRYHAATDTWEAAVAVDASDHGRLAGAALAVDRSGNAFVAWRRGDGARGMLPLWTSTFVARTGAWTAAARLDGDAGLPAVAAAGDRQAVVVWQRQDGGEVRAARFDPRSGTWADPALLGVGDASPQSPRVAVSDAGDAVTIFARREGEAHGLWSVHTIR